MHTDGCGQGLTACWTRSCTAAGQHVSVNVKQQRHMQCVDHGCSCGRCAAVPCPMLASANVVLGSGVNLPCSTEQGCCMLCCSPAHHEVLAWFKRVTCSLKAYGMPARQCACQLAVWQQWKRICLEGMVVLLPSGTAWQMLSGSA